MRGARYAQVLFLVGLVVLTVAVLLATGSVGVDRVRVAGHGPLGSLGGDCENVTVQQVTVNVEVTRSDLDRVVPTGRWHPGDPVEKLVGADSATVTVEVTALGETRTREVTVAGEESTTVALTLRQMTAGDAAAETVDAVVEVRRGGTVLFETTRAVELPAVEAGTNCEG